MELSGGAGVLGVAVVVLLAAGLVVGGRRAAARRRGPSPDSIISVPPRRGAEGWERGQRHSSWYRSYMQGPTWQARRQRTLMLAGGLCQQCGRAKATDAHHLTYVRLGFEEDKDLKALCSRCHQKAHPERRYA